MVNDTAPFGHARHKPAMAKGSAPARPMRQRVTLPASSYRGSKKAAAGNGKVQPMDAHTTRYTVWTCGTGLDLPDRPLPTLCRRLTQRSLDGSFQGTTAVHSVNLAHGCSA